MTPLLSIVTITYNHEPYIAQTIEGVLMQKVNFPIEYIIAEDHSTDGTRRICQEYASRYPDIIRLITSENNVGAIANERRAMLATRGSYIAFCEGDDYWTDPLKLQKQVDFLESHPDYSVTFHRCSNLDVVTGEFQADRYIDLFKEDNIQGIDINLGMVFKNWLVQPLTMLYRKSMFNLDLSLNYNYYRDTHLTYHLLKAGKGYLLNFDGAVRQVHSGSISYSASERSSERGYEISKELYLCNKDEYTLQYYIDNCNWYFGDLVRTKQKLKALKIALQILKLNRKPITFVRNIKSILTYA